MRRIALLAILASAALLSVAAALAQTIPQPVGHVNDFADVIDAHTEAAFEETLRQFEQETTVELAVVTVPDLGGTTVEDYAVRLFEQWGIGKKGVDNGVLLLLAVEERRVRIEVGYGMEPYITDGQAGRILDAEVIPDLRYDNYTLGLLKGTQAIAQAIVDSDYEPGAVRPRPRFDLAERVEGYSWLLGLLGILSMYLLSFIGRTREVVVGTLWGGVVGGVLGWLLGGLLFIIVGVIGLALVGLLLDFALSSAYKSQKRSGKSTSWHRTWGGFSGAGRGGGGFGGFGGGRSGGGGASRGF